MAKAKKAAPKKIAPKKVAAKKIATKKTVKHVQKNNDLVEDQQDQGEGLTEAQKVSDVLQNNKAAT